MSRGGQTGLTKENCLTTHNAGGFIGEFLLVPLVGCEADCHFGDYAGNDSAETFVKTQRSLSFDNLFPSFQKAPSLRLYFHQRLKLGGEGFIILLALMPVVTAAFEL